MLLACMVLSCGVPANPIARGGSRRGTFRTRTAWHVADRGGEIPAGLRAPGLLELDRARAELTGSATDIAGIVTVGLLPSTCEVLASSLMSAVVRDHPRIRMRLAVGYMETLQQWLEKGEVDVALLPSIRRRASSPHSCHTFAEGTALGGRPCVRETQQTATCQSRESCRQTHDPARRTPRRQGHGGLRLCDVQRDAADFRRDQRDERPEESRSRWPWLHHPAPISFAKELANGELTGAPLQVPEITRTLVLALPANRTVGRHVRYVVDQIVECAHDTLTSKRWPEAQWVVGKNTPT